MKIERDKKRHIQGVYVFLRPDHVLFPVDDKCICCYRHRRRRRRRRHRHWCHHPLLFLSCVLLLFLVIFISRSHLIHFAARMKKKQQKSFSFTFSSRNCDIDACLLSRRRTQQQRTKKRNVLFPFLLSFLSHTMTPVWNPLDVANIRSLKIHFYYSNKNDADYISPAQHFSQCLTVLNTKTVVHVTRTNIVHNFIIAYTHLESICVVSTIHSIASIIMMIRVMNDFSYFILLSRRMASFFAIFHRCRLHCHHHCCSTF